MDSYNFLYTCDKNYFPHMYTSLYSLLLHHQDCFTTINIIEDGFSESEYSKINGLNKLFKSTKINIYPISIVSNLINYYEIPKWSGTDIANARLFAGEIFSGIDKLLYIDSDTLILNSLKDLFNKNYDYPVNAVRELEIPLHFKSANVRNYYNSGVLMFNLESLRKMDYLSVISDTLKDNQIPLLFPDQDILNLTLRDKIGDLTPDYNLVPLICQMMNYPYLAKYKFKYNNENYYSYDEICNSLNKIHIVHLLGGLFGRPWDNNKINPYNKLYEEYRTIWDKDFTREENDLFLTKMLTTPLLNVLFVSLMPADFVLSTKNELINCFYKKGKAQ